MLFSVEECNPVRYLSFVDESEIRYWSTGSDQSQTPAPGKTCNYVQNARLVTKWDGKRQIVYAQEALGCVSCGKCPNLCEGLPCLDDPFVLFRCCVRAVSLDLAPCVISGTNLSLVALSPPHNNFPTPLSPQPQRLYRLPPASLHRAASRHAPKRGRRQNRRRKFFSSDEQRFWLWCRGGDCQFDTCLT